MKRRKYFDITIVNTANQQTATACLCATNPPCASRSIQIISLSLCLINLVFLTGATNHESCTQEGIFTRYVWEFGENVTFFFLRCFRVKIWSAELIKFAVEYKTLGRELSLMFLNALNTYPVAWESPLPSSYETTKCNIKHNRVTGLWWHQHKQFNQNRKYNYVPREN